jgi:D-3-phosphoglycerate dehydrogenase
VDSQAVLTALESGKVASYVTDFPSEEMLGVPGVVAIPHLGASTPESEDNCALMAAEQLMDYIENGNIVNSVNLPEITMPRSSEKRICVIHKNIPNTLTALTGIVAKDGVNIENMLNKSRGDYAYTMLDVAPTDYEKVAEEISAVNGVIRVRVI